MDVGVGGHWQPEGFGGKVATGFDGAGTGAGSCVGAAVVGSLEGRGVLLMVGMEMGS